MDQEYGMSLPFSWGPKQFFCCYFLNSFLQISWTHSSSFVDKLHDQPNCVAKVISVRSGKKVNSHFVNPEYPSMFYFIGYSIFVCIFKENILISTLFVKSWTTSFVKTRMICLSKYFQYFLEFFTRVICIDQKKKKKKTRVIQSQLRVIFL